MKKIFIFVFLLFSIIFFSSCHDDGLSGIIDKSELPPPRIDQIVAYSDETHKETRLDKFIRKNPYFKRIVEDSYNSENIRRNVDV
ncbi:hypothetical protein [Blattabacterium cuenoti]|uniref:hypothetical protein n=1 Tax=Blattabacterium cuenoti TaxID=1653831 RepID=UPI00311DA485